MKRLSILGSCAAAAATTLVLAMAVFGGTPDRASAALPATATASFGEIAVTTADGRDIVLPAKEVTCTLEDALSETEGLYNCPAPHDLSSYILPPTTAAVGLGSLAPGPSPDALVFVRSNVIISGLPANSWQTVQINYGTTLTAPFQAVLGAELAKGETGHIENTSSPNTSRAVFSSFFRYRATTNASGYLGTEWLAIGT